MRKAPKPAPNSANQRRQVTGTDTTTPPAEALAIAQRNVEIKLGDTLVISGLGWPDGKYRVSKVTSRTPKKTHDRIRRASP